MPEKRNKKRNMHLFNPIPIEIFNFIVVKAVHLCNQREEKSKNKKRKILNKKMERRTYLFLHPPLLFA